MPRRSRHASTPGSPTLRWWPTTSGRSATGTAPTGRPSEGGAGVGRCAGGQPRPRGHRAAAPAPALPGRRVGRLRPGPGRQPPVPAAEAAVPPPVHRPVAQAGRLVRRPAGRAGGPAARRVVPPPVVPGLLPRPHLSRLPRLARRRHLRLPVAVRPRPAEHRRAGRSGRHRPGHRPAGRGGRGTRLQPRLRPAGDALGGQPHRPAHRHLRRHRDHRRPHHPGARRDPRLRRPPRPRALLPFTAALPGWRRQELDHPPAPAAGGAVPPRPGRHRAPQAHARLEAGLHQAAAVESSPSSQRPLSVISRIRLTSGVSQFFRDTAAWEWDDVPGRPLIGPGDAPKHPQRVPRFIPDDELARLMAAVAELACPYQRAALLVARWSGARRGEIRRLALDCLDHYPDGTPRLRLPAGKTYRERAVPMHEQAAVAVQKIIDLPGTGRERAFTDELTGTPTRYLFMRHGKLLSTYYLFDTPLRQACKAAGLVDGQGRAIITAHRFRHTVGTQLAERGAKLHTIMRVLGHSSVSMALVYAQISDREVLREYQAVLGPGATIAGPAAEELREHALPDSAVDWLKTNFFKTELELGHCLRLPAEGPCECDLYLTCAKFVTTPAYAPRLRERRHVELALAEDAAAHGWPREVERHQCTATRLEKLLDDLGEPLEGPEDGDDPR